MSKNLNVSPYYDDFDGDKNFLRVLFRPGRGVQARELTQAQSILQNQIGKFANHVFQNGTSIIGANVKVNFNKEYFIVDAINEDSNPVNVSDFLGKKITGQTSGGTATVTNVDPITRKIYYDVLGSSFVDAENVWSDDGTPFKATITATTFGSKSILSYIESGIVYVDGLFIAVPEQEHFVNTDINTGDYEVGFTLSEDFVTSDNDSSLLDPASGSPNFNAPGADRYRGQAILSSFELGSSQPENFISLVSIKNNAIIRTQEKVQYSDILELLSRRTYDESGNYTTSPFRLAVDEESGGDSTKLDLVLSEGKAYVHGYEHEKISSTTLKIDRARDSRLDNNASIYAYYGPYFDVADNAGNPDIVGMFNVKEKELINLHTGATKTGDTIGQCRVNAVVLSPTGGLRFYISDYGNLLNLFSSVRSVSSVSDATVYANVDKHLDDTTPATIFNRDVTVGIFKLRKSMVKDVVLNETNYDVERNYVNLVKDGSSNFVITAPDIYTDFYSSSQNGVIYAVNSATGAFLESGVDFTYSVVNSVGSQSTLTISGAAPANIDVLVRMYKSQGNPKTKTITDVTQNFTTGVGETTKILSNTDILEIISVIKDPAGAAIDVTDQVTVDNGQKDYIYDYGSLSGLEASTTYDVTYAYFAHSGTGDYFAVNSYTNATNEAIYSDIYSRIPYYESENDIFSLRDCIDFRRSVTDLASGTDMVFPDTNIRVDYNFYLSRIDKVYINKEGVFGTITGTYSDSPEVPNDLNDAMSLYLLFVSAYTIIPSDVSIEYIDNKNYTMRDIGDLEKRIENIEYYSSLNLLEKSTEELSVIDPYGNEKYKNGIIVDNFTGHNIGNVRSSEYKCSIDPENKVLRPQFTVENVDQDVKTNTSVTVHDHIATLDYTLSPLITQNKASSWINVNPYNVFNWVGKCELTPESDNWIDTVREPTVTINIEGQNDNLAITSQNWMGTRWNAWETIWTGEPRRTESRRDWEKGDEISIGRGSFLRQDTWRGTPVSAEVVSTTTVTPQTRRRTGIRTSIVPNTIRTSIGDRVVDTSIIPWIRARTINWSATGLKPSTTLKAFFDGVEVTAYCTGLTSDASGSASGTFAIPNTDSVKFRTGNILFRIADDQTNPTTSAESRYAATGILQTKQDTIISMDNPRLVQTEVQETNDRTRTTRTNRLENVVWADPIAESFLVDVDGAGVFVKDIDLYFKTKDSSLPVTVHIVEMENGYPTQRILPYSEKTLLPASVNVTADGSVATKFTFTDPVFLQNNTEYAFVVLSNSDKYEAFVSEIGGTDLIDGNVISKQPYAGVMFTSQNASTWSADQDKDIKFTLNRCVFGTSGIIETHNKTPATDVLLTNMYINTDQLIFTESNIIWEYSFAGDVSNTPYTTKTNIEFTEQKTLTNTDVTPRSLTLKGTLTSSNDMISPCINIHRNSIIAANNTVVADGGADLFAGAYLTKTITIDDPSDDIKVLFDAKIPSGTDVNVYFRTSTTATPRYVEVSDFVYSDFVGFKQYVYHWDGATITNVGNHVTTKIDTLSTPDRNYMKEIYDLSVYIDPADWVSSSLDATKGVMIIDDANITSIEEYNGATTYALGDYVFYSNLVWKSAIASNLGNTPTVAGSAWTQVNSSIVDSVVTDDTELTWQEMTQENTIKPYVDVTKDFVEYVYVPSEVITDEFTAFAIKLEMRATTPAVIPLIKAFRGLSVY